MDIKQQLKTILVERLRLKVAPEQIDDAAPLFGEGLGLDSIDALELAIAIQKQFGVEIKDETEGRAAFRSIDALADFIAQHTRP